MIEGVRLRVSGVGAVQPRGHRRQAASFGGILPHMDHLPGSAPAIGAPDLDALDGLLALQESQTEAVVEREARRHGQDMLHALGRLQLSLLTPTGPAPADLTHLAGLCETVPYAENAALRSLLQSVALRARIELARR